MHKEIETFKQLEKQGTSSSGEKQGSPSDFAAGKPLKGILKRKYDNIQDTERSKKHNDIQNKQVKIDIEINKTIKIDASLDKDIKIDYKDNHTIFNEHLEIFRDTFKDIMSNIKDFKQSLSTKDVFLRSGIEAEDLLLLYTNEKVICDMYNDSKEQKSEELFDLSIKQIVNNVEIALAELDKLKKLKREIE